MDGILKNKSENNTNFQENQEISNPEGYVAPEDLDSRWLRWKCLVCGYNYEGAVGMKVCPKCGNQDPDKFEDAE